MTSIASFPQEIVDAVLDQLTQLCQGGCARDDDELVHENLRSCMQISRSFRSRARDLLFSNVTLVVTARDRAPTSSRNFRALLEGDPDLARLVRSFRLNFKGHSDHYFPNQKILDENLPAILGLLSNIQKLIMASLDGRTGWQGFNNDIVTAMFKLHDLPDLKSLELFGYNLSVPVDFVARWSTLSNLIVHASPFDSYNNARKRPMKKPIVPTYIKERPFPYLTSLDLITNFGSSNILLDVGKGALFRRLINLKAHVYGQRDWSLLWKILRQECITVQHLTIYNLFSYIPVSQVIQVAVATDKLDLPSLRSLTLEEGALGMEQDDVRDIVNLLSNHLAISPSLESVRMSLAWSCPLVNVTNLRADSWSQLDQTLASANGFERLDVTMHCLYGTQVIADVLKAHFAEDFKQWNPQNTFPILSGKASSIVRLSLLDSLLR